MSLPDALQTRFDRAAPGKGLPFLAKFLARLRMQRVALRRDWKETAAATAAASVTASAPAKAAAPATAATHAAAN
jgi:hypothetical protein